MNKKILIVDDSDIERMYLKELTRRIDNVKAEEAKGFADAIKKLEAEKYDLIIVDYYLLDGQGDELMKMIISGNPSGNADTNAIVLGRESDFEKSFLKDSGFSNYIEKPVEFNMLQAAISMYA
ncbi:response regulator [Butyrivibrio sp. AE3004]|uniref:response regulator n=1 Tax=Butyrivibrio sp. AE3004 TaxID=1506994 RepID=UPI000494A4A1|nr:response regulator [Butyrivibrio sp. AE3004]